MGGVRGPDLQHPVRRHRDGTAIAEAGRDRLVADRPGAGDLGGGDVGPPDRLRGQPAALEHGLETGSGSIRTHQALSAKSMPARAWISVVSKTGTGRSEGATSRVISVQPKITPSAPAAAARSVMA